MGMTIDKAILRVEHSQMSVDDKETADFIVNTMRKYQKIKEIMAKRPKDMISSNPTLRAINEVVEDGLHT